MELLTAIFWIVADSRSRWKPVTGGANNCRFSYFYKWKTSNPSATFVSYITVVNRKTPSLSRVGFKKHPMLPLMITKQHDTISPSHVSTTTLLSYFYQSGILSQLTGYCFKVTEWTNKRYSETRSFAICINVLCWWAVRSYKHCFSLVKSCRSRRQWVIW
jgi:hypothetical protein